METVCKALDLVEKLQKENEELKIKNNAIKRESEAYAEHMIRLDDVKAENTGCHVGIDRNNKQKILGGVLSGRK